MLRSVVHTPPALGHSVPLSVTLMDARFASPTGLLLLLFRGLPRLLQLFAVAASFTLRGFDIFWLVSWLDSWRRTCEAAFTSLYLLPHGVSQWLPKGYNRGLS
ncbi:unnamed protein product [Prorocentrum cordatum]|uniref:Mannosyltransferase n=1 Tax=Prorocentrum cordatum TaxID=2364126 RepID=A0ABN9SRL8_9DINO|nr:unnamed protein product [Polarella glacialis]